MDHADMEEQQIVDRYVRGTLPAEEVARFEEHYLSCPVCLDRLDLAESMNRGFKRAAGQDAARVAAARQLAVVAWLSRLSRSRQAAVLTMTLLVAVLLPWGLAVRRMAGRDRELATARSPSKVSLPAASRPPPAASPSACCPPAEPPELSFLEAARKGECQCRTQQRLPERWVGSSSGFPNSCLSSTCSKRSASPRKFLACTGPGRSSGAASTPPRLPSTAAPPLRRAARSWQAATARDSGSPGSWTRAFSPPSRAFPRWIRRTLDSARRRTSNPRTRPRKRGSASPDLFPTPTTRICGPAPISRS